MKKHFVRLLAGVFCAVTLFGVLPNQKNESMQAQAKTYVLTSTIGYPVNVTKRSNAILNTSILDHDFIFSDEMKVVKSVEVDGGTDSVFGGSYKEFAERYSKLMKRDTCVYNEGIFFSYDYYPTFSPKYEKKCATQFLYYYRNDIVEYELTLENASYFNTTYADKLNPLFTKALDELLAEELDYSKFFDTFGTHVITGSKFGKRQELLYGRFYYSDFLDDSDLIELANEIEKNISIRADGELLNEPDHAIAGKYGIGKNVGMQSSQGFFGDGSVEIAISHMVALYDALPKKYEALIDPMKEAFQAYLEANTELYEDSLLPKPVEEPEPDVDSSSSDSGNSNGRVEPILIGIGIGVGVVAVAVVCVLLIRKKKKKS